MSTRSSVKRTWTGTLRQESSRISTRARSCENLPSKCRTPRAENPAAHTLCEPALSKCIWTCQKSSVLREFTRKMPHPKIGAPVLLRRSYAHGHLTRAIACENLQEKKNGAQDRDNPGTQIVCEPRAILCENLQEKCQWAESVPWSNPGLNPYRQNPSVWTHCLGKVPPQIHPNCWISLKIDGFLTKKLP